MDILTAAVQNVIAPRSQFSSRATWPVYRLDVSWSWPAAARHVRTPRPWPRVTYSGARPWGRPAGDPDAERIAMALYAFDGTWNSDKPGSQHDTNVLWFKQAYGKECFYREGVGTRFGPFGQVLGGITGAGGHTRIHEGLQQLEQNLAAGDADIDVVGFSRGAALAV